MYSEPTLRLTHRAVLAMLEAAASEAEAIGQPQCIVIVDVSGESLGQLRMGGAKFLSLKSTRAKARTAASIGGETSSIPESVGSAIAATTEGNVTRLGGGLPVYLCDVLVGGIAVGSDSPDQDRTFARAALAAIAAAEA